MNASSAATRTTRRALLADARLYLCTDSRASRGDLREFLHACYEGGTDIIQLRDKNSAGEREFGPLEAKDELAALAILLAATKRHGALLAVNDRADLALASGADVLHLGQGDLPVHYARQILGPDVVIGRSTQNRAQSSLAAIEDGVDYFAVGPVWPTPTKPNRKAAGLETLRATADSLPERPWFAIGGVDATNVDQVRAAGADRIVVVRAITEARDPQAAARSLVQALQP